MTSESILAALKAALAASPDNVELRRHLADALLGLGRAQEACDALREAVRLAPGDSDAKLALARAYRAAGKHSAAHVILEQMIRDDERAGAARVERARTLFAEGQVEESVREYQKAVDEDPDAADEEFAERLGITDEPEEDGPEFGRMRMRNEPTEDTPRWEPLKTDVDFAQVGGMDELKKSIRRKIIDPLEHPEMYAAYGKKVGGGILLYGPPGCGKTHLAKATAGEINATFLAIGIHDVLDMWIGNSERNLHQIFEVARANKPCVLFFDEADALGASRGDMKQSAGRHVINQFLAELDGVKADNDGVLILAATNTPWQMDSAFRRPGRFDRVVFVPPPDAPARASILRILLDGKPQKDLDLATVAKKTDGFSGADLKAVVDVAVEDKIEAAVAAGAISPLTTKDLVRAAKSRKPTTREWFRTVRNYVRYANEDGLYDELKPYVDL